MIEQGLLLYEIDATAIVQTAETLRQIKNDHPTPVQSDKISSLVYQPIFTVVTCTKQVP